MAIFKYLNNLGDVYDIGRRCNLFIHFIQCSPGSHLQPAGVISQAINSTGYFPTPTLLVISYLATAGGQTPLGRIHGFALLAYLARNAGRVVSKTMIMEHVWDYNFDPQTNVVESRICRLREKIDRGFDRPLIQTIRGVGYVLRSDP